MNYTVNDQGILVNASGDRVSGQDWSDWQREQALGRNNADNVRRSRGRRTGYTYETDEDGNITRTRVVSDGLVGGANQVLTGDAFRDALKASMATDSEVAAADYAHSRLMAARARQPLPGRIDQGWKPVQPLAPSPDQGSTLAERRAAALAYLNESSDYSRSFWAKPRVVARPRVYFDYEDES